MHPTPPILPADARARYNRKWGLWLLLINTILLFNLPDIEWLHDFISKFDPWVLAGLTPWVVLGMAVAVMVSLPKALRKPLYVITGLLLAISLFLTYALLTF